MDAVLSIDTTKGNRICNAVGFAISPTMRQGWVLRVIEDLLSVQQRVTGRLPVVLPVTTQDITPYGNGVFHINSILQPATATHAPVVGVAITTETPVAGSATGATSLSSVEEAARSASTSGVHPPTFESLGLVPFQINPHYINPDPKSGHMGETRDERLAEFHEENDVAVLGLREDAWLSVRDDRAVLGGETGARLFRRGAEPQELVSGANLSPLLGETPRFDQGVGG
jgi:hypothetical protein